MVKFYFEDSHQPTPPDYSKQQSSFTVHQDYLYHYSPKVKSKLDELPTTADGVKSYCLGKRDLQKERAVKLFIQWLYMETFDGFITHAESFAQKPVHAIKDREEVKLRQYDMIGLWIVADEFHIPTLKNVIIDQLQRSTRKYRLLTMDWWNGCTIRNGDKPPTKLRSAVADIVACMIIEENSLGTGRVATSLLFNVDGNEGREMAKDVIIALAG